MRFFTVAALISGGAASVIPSFNPFAVVQPKERRQVETTPAPDTCGSYTTVTVTPDVVTVTTAEYVTVTAETVTTTEVSIAESTQEVTDVETVTEVETAFFTETATAATETETVVVQQRKMKRNCGRKTKSGYPVVAPTYTASVAAQTSSPSAYPVRGSSSSALVTSSSSAPVTSSSTSSEVVSSSSSEPVTSSSSSTSSEIVCTTTITAEASTTTTTVTITDSATATATETSTSLIVDTVTITVSATESVTTDVTTTESVTATTTVTTTVVPPTPTVILQASGGGIDGQYVSGLTSGTFNLVSFSSAVAAATTFTLSDSGVLVPTTNTNIAAYFSRNVGETSFVLLTTAQYGADNGGETLICQYNGATAVGSSGSFTCSNSGSTLTNFANQNGRLTVQTSTYTDPVITLQYIVLG